jgi:hypothetical protein
MKGIKLDVDRSYFIETGMIGVNNNNKLLFFYCSERKEQIIKKDCFYVKQWDFTDYLVKDIINTKSYAIILGKKKNTKKHIVIHLEKWALVTYSREFTDDVELFNAFEHKKAIIHVKRIRG